MIVFFTSSRSRCLEFECNKTESSSIALLGFVCYQGNLCYLKKKTRIKFSIPEPLYYSKHFNLLYSAHTELIMTCQTYNKLIMTMTTPIINYDGDHTHNQLIMTMTTPITNVLSYSPHQTFGNNL